MQGTPASSGGTILSSVNGQYFLQVIPSPYVFEPYVLTSEDISYANQYSSGSGQKEDNIYLSLALKNDWITLPAWYLPW